MEYAMSDCPHKPDFDPKILAKVQFDDTTLQELLISEASNWSLPVFVHISGSLPTVEPWSSSISFSRNRLFEIAIRPLSPDFGTDYQSKTKSSYAVLSSVEDAMKMLDDFCKQLKSERWGHTNYNRPRTVRVRTQGCWIPYWKTFYIQSTTRCHSRRKCSKIFSFSTEWFWSFLKLMISGYFIWE